MNRLPINNTNLKQALGIDNSLHNCFHVFFLFFLKTRQPSELQQFKNSYKSFTQDLFICI
jgi:hypothetical protein